MVIIQKELKGIRKMINTCIDDIDTNMMDMTDKINNDVDHCINKIKEVSVDNLHQLKKINMINHQHITSNHFTETEDSEVKTDVNNFSDAMDSDNKYMIFEKPNDMNSNENSDINNGNYYMSETDNFNKSERSSLYVESSANYNINKDMIDNDSDNSINERTSNIERTENTQFGDDNEDEIGDVGYPDDIVVNNLINMMNSDQNDLTASFSEHVIMSKGTNDSLIEDEEIEDVEIEYVGYNNANDIYLDNNVDNDNDDDQIDCTLSEDILNDCIDDDLDTDSFIDNENTIPINNIDDTELIEELKRSSPTDNFNELEVDIQNILDKSKLLTINNDLINIHDDFDNELDKEPNNQPDENVNSNIITICTNIESSDESEDFEEEVASYLGSKYSGQISLVSDNKIIKNDKEESNYDSESVIKNMNYNDLEDINSYNLIVLRKIAKNLSLFVSFKDEETGKWKQYKKEELYKNIQEYLEQK